MIDKHIKKIAAELKLTFGQVRSTLELLDNDATIPFISRYRKETTGSLDEVEVGAIRDRIVQLRELDKRREAILKSLEERDLLTDELKEAIESAETMTELEDIYLPYKPKKRTKATIAREKGLEPLADLIYDQEQFDIYSEAEKYIDLEKEVSNTDDALAGARDIIAEWISEDSEIRSDLRHLYATSGVIRSKVIKGKDEEGAKFSDYFDWEEPITKSPSHRILAMRRGENEGILSLKITPDEDKSLKIIRDHAIINNNDASDQVELALTDSYKRLLAPSMETEIRNESKKQAESEAIRVFAENLRELLMAPPLGQKNILALDPGFRTGCKLVCLNKQGKLLLHETIHPHTSQSRRDEASDTILKLVKKYNTEVIAVGNGTAGRETITFLKELNLSPDILIEMVNESGASVYSASPTAREEFPDHDITVRGSVSIGRRLIDPLAELVKIDPKSIGVGQYQHDVDQSDLRGSLDDVVMSCVNKVGVEINTASKQLLTYVSGLGATLAENIIKYRDENGPFKSRSEFKKVARLGPKAFEQSAGFLRIADAKNPLDRSAVHPESYYIVKKMADDQNNKVDQLMNDENLKQKIDLNKYIDDKVGLPTLTDIIDELTQPGRDPREKFELFSFDENVNSVKDLKAGMVLPGIITNVTNFGAFVDIGVHQDGLVHISELADKFIKDPHDFVKVRQKVKVTVLDIDLDRNRIALSLRQQTK